MGKPDLHYSQLLRVDGDQTSIRPFTIREFGRLMGLPSDYRMPPTVRRAAKLSGEGVAVPVVRWLAAHLLEPLAAAEQVPGAVSAVPLKLRRPARARKEVQVAPQPGARLKQKTICKTAYLLHDESARVHELAASVGVSVHELLMQGLDRMFMGRGSAPVRRIPKTQRASRASRAGNEHIARLPSRRRRANSHGRSHTTGRAAGAQIGSRKLGLRGAASCGARGRFAERGLQPSARVDVAWNSRAPNRDDFLAHRPESQDRKLQVSPGERQADYREGQPGRRYQVS